MSNSKETKNFRNSTNSAFTLIELLVVIAIIAILAAILFPVFARARENARRSSCQSNVKQIMLGVLQYVQDYDEHYPFGHNQSGGVSGGYQNWYIATDPYLKSRQIFVCPSDSSTAGAGNTGLYAPPNGFHVSYAANVWISQQNQGVNIAEIQSPSTVAYISDAGRSADGPNGTITPTSTEVSYSGLRMLVDPVGGYPSNTGSQDFMGPIERHLDTVVVGFADGHVKSLKANSWFYANSWQMHPDCSSKTGTGDCL